MKVMVFDVGGTEIKYSVMDEQFHRAGAGVLNAGDTQEALSRHAGGHLLSPHAAEVTVLP